MKVSAKLSAKKLLVLIHLPNRVLLFPWYFIKLKLVLGTIFNKGTYWWCHMIHELDFDLKWFDLYNAEQIREQNNGNINHPFCQLLSLAETLVLFWKLRFRGGYRPPLWTMLVKTINWLISTWWETLVVNWLKLGHSLSWNNSSWWQIRKPQRKMKNSMQDFSHLPQMQYFKFPYLTPFSTIRTV